MANLIKNKFLNFARAMRLKFVLLCSKNRFLGRLYYVLEPSFDREFEYTLCGRYEALSSRYANDFSNANVRRSIHRLEKGLFHRNPRARFGSDVFKELLSELRHFENMRCFDISEVRWGIMTLKSYREYTDQVALVDQAISVLERMEQNCHNDAGDVEIGGETDEFEMLAELYFRRESVRFFNKEKAIDVGLIEKAVKIAKEAPSACNRQPYSIHLLREKNNIEYIGGLAPGTQGFLDNIPVLGVIVGHGSAFRFTRDRHLLYTDSGLFLGHLLPALESLGLSTCILNWVPDWENDRNAIKYLDLDMSKTIVCLFAIGYRDETPSPRSDKKSNKTLLRYFDGS